MVSTQVVTAGTVFGSACLAFWLVVCHPGLGPRSLRSALVTCAVAAGLLQLVAPVAKWTMELAGPAIALLAVVVPVFVGAFWAGATLARAIVVRAR